MKKLFPALITLMLAHSVLAMPCDAGWSCKSSSGKDSIDVQRCRYTNSIGNLQSVKINGIAIQGAEITASYDSLSIGGSVLAIEVKVPDSKNDAHFLAFEYDGKSGLVTERVQPFNPGPQKVVKSEPISCQETE